MAKRKAKTKSRRSTKAVASSVANDNKNLKYLLIIALLVLTLIWVVKKNNENSYLMTTSPQVDDNKYPQINNNDDLNNALMELDKNDPINMDAEIKGLDAESSGL